MTTAMDWLSGHLSASARIWTALAPALLLIAYFLGGLLLYTIRYVRRGPHHDREIESRGSSLLAGMWVRLAFVWIMQPIWKGLRRSGIPCDAITTLSLLLALAAGVSLAAGRFALGGWLYIFAGICDFFDGRLARASGQARPSGPALDSVLDRYSDAAVLAGLALFYRDTWVLAPVLGALIGSMMVPYIRARGEALGVVMKDVGLMQRAERILYLGVSVALSPVLEVVLDPYNPRPLHRLAVAGIVLLAVSTQLTALRRFVYLLRALDGRLGPRARLLGQGGLLRSLSAALIATAADFALVVALVTWAGAPPWVATALGSTVGAGVNFTLNRRWTFGSGAPAPAQLGRYGAVSVTSALLNAGGVAVLLLLPQVDYRLAWGIVRVAVAVAWNYPLHRDYVFACPDRCTGDRRLDAGLAP